MTSPAAPDTAAAAALPERINEELLACKVCFLRYAADNPPKILACSHTFCQHCIEDYMKGRHRRAKHFPCPLCRKETAVGEPRLLANNYTVLELMDMVVTPHSTQQADDETKCCVCRGAEGLHPLKCEHKVCRSCHQKDKMEVLSCEVCVALSPAGVTGDNPPPYCERDDRPPPYNVDYHGNAPTAPAHTTLAEEFSGRLAIGTQREVLNAPPGTVAGYTTGYPAVPYQYPAGVMYGQQYTQQQPYPPVDPSYQPQRVAPPVPPPPEYSEVTASDPPQPIRSPPDPAQPIRSPPDQAQPIRSSPVPVPGGVAVLPRPPVTPSGGQAESPPGGCSSPAQATVAPPVVKKRQAPSAAKPETSSPQPPGQVPIATPSGPKVPPRRLLGEPQGLPFKCVRKIGRHSNAKMQSGAFEAPTRVSVSEDGGNIVVTDTQGMTVQVFTAEGEYVYMFKVLGVQGASMWAQDRLAAATHRGVEIYNITGYQEKELPVGHTLNTVPYKHGFLAVQPKSVHVYSAVLSQVRQINKKKVKSSLIKKSAAFENIRDAAVTMSKDIVVLEGNPGEITIMDDDGVVKQVIQPQNESCGKLLDPFSVTVDRWANIFASDLQSRKLLRFSPNGRFSRRVLNFTLGETSGTVAGGDVKAYGVSASGGADHLVTVVAGTNAAEIRVYKLF